MQPRIAISAEKKLAGKRTLMSFANNKTRELWQGFMSKRKELINNAGEDLYSIEVYNNTLFFQNFNPALEFEKWAAVEVTNLDSVPDELEKLILPAGLYAVFIHKGPASEGQRTYEYIFRTWLPVSDFELDDRPHFALMGEKYKNDDPTSEEEIWIPIKKKNAPGK
ncbi:MAG: GyrI-like domain-containing protein [Sphingobacteriales bacterium]